MNNSSEIDLIFVPQWSPFQPPLSLPALSGWLQKEGISHTCKDLNVDFYWWLFSEECSNILLSIVKLSKFSDAEKDAYAAIFRNAKKYRNHVYGIRFSNSKNGSLIDRTYLSNKALETYLQVISEVNEDFSISPYDFSLSGEHLNLDNLNSFLAFPPPLLAAYIEHATDKIINDNPAKSIGLSCIGQEQLFFTLLIGKEIKQRTSSTVIVGGTILSRMVNRGVLPKIWFEQYFDIIVKNEGEKPLVKILEAQRLIEPTFSEIRGVVLLDKVNSEIISSDPESPLKPSELPIPNFQQIALDSYISPEITLPILSSRGCYWGKCAFCHHGMVYGEKYSSYDVDRLLVHIQELSSKYNVYSFAFNDEAIPPKVLRKIGEIFPNKNLSNWSFTGLIKFEKYFQKEDYFRAYRVGFRSLYVGLESGSERVLELMKKNNTQETMEKNLKDASDAGIWMHCFVFFGFPGETESDAQTTYDFILKNKDIIGSVGCGTFSMEHDAPIQKAPTVYGVKLISEQSSSIDVYYSYETDTGINAKEASSWLKKLNNEIYKIDKFSTTNWIPREHQLTILSHYKVTDLIKWGVHVKNNYGIPLNTKLSDIVISDNHGSSRLYMSTIFRNVMKLDGTYEEAVKMVLERGIIAKEVAKLSHDIVSRFGCANDIASHAFTPKVI